MKKRVLVGAVVAAAALIGAPPVEATPSSAAHVLGPVVLNGDGTASVTVQYVCPVQGSHVWMSAKQVEDRHPDKRLAGEGSSGISAGWWQSHPLEFTCDGTWQTDTFVIGTFEYGIGELESGQAWVQFCVAGESGLLINETGWRAVVSSV
jgi:hypothetical protein